MSVDAKCKARLYCKDLYWVWLDCHDLRWPCGLHGYSNHSECNQRSIYAVTKLCLPAGLDKCCTGTQYVCITVIAIISNSLTFGSRLIPKFIYMYKMIPNAKCLFLTTNITFSHKSKWRLLNSTLPQLTIKQCI